MWGWGCVCARMYAVYGLFDLTRWGRLTHMSQYTNHHWFRYHGLSPGRRQAIIWTNAGILLVGPLGTNSSIIFVQENGFESVVCKMASILSRLQWVKMRLGSAYKCIMIVQAVSSSNSLSCPWSHVLGIPFIWFTGTWRRIIVFVLHISKC